MGRDDQRHRLEVDLAGRGQRVQGRGDVAAQRRMGVPAVDQGLLEHGTDVEVERTVLHDALQPAQFAVPAAGQQCPRGDVLEEELVAEPDVPSLVLEQDRPAEQDVERGVEVGHRAAVPCGGHVPCPGRQLLVGGLHGTRGEEPDGDAGAGVPHVAAAAAHGIRPPVPVAADLVVEVRAQHVEAVDLLVRERALVRLEEQPQQQRMAADLGHAQPARRHPHHQRDLRADRLRRRVGAERLDVALDHVVQLVLVIGAEPHLVESRVEGVRLLLTAAHHGPRARVDGGVEHGVGPVDLMLLMEEEIHRVEQEHGTLAGCREGLDGADEHLSVQHRIKARLGAQPGGVDQQRAERACQLLVQAPQQAGLAVAGLAHDLRAPRLAGHPGKEVALKAAWHVQTGAVAGRAPVRGLERLVQLGREPLAHPQDPCHLAIAVPAPERLGGGEQGAENRAQLPAHAGRGFLRPFGGQVEARLHDARIPVPEPLLEAVVLR
ncbi:hypothetical protein LUX57_52240 [Actinomadura madurae]|uniref:hypothetical protein n=1 Tax=Actinomadura madurae TaxID=1993 RepID=UPI0020D241B8|nr:hypothetical protein [Actinomadura madurae]MCP9972601.1 hypothetical protein [Actinomadura madurae]